MRVRSIALTALGVIVLCLATSWAGRPKNKDLPQFNWEEVTPADWQIPADSLLGGHNAIVLFSTCEADDSLVFKNMCLLRLYKRIRILGAAGRSAADIQVPYLDKEQQILDIKARTILPGGQVIEFDPTTVQEKTVFRAEGIKVRQKSFSLPGVTDSCLIEYTVLSKTPRHVSSWVYQEDLPVLKGQYRWKYYNFAQRDSVMQSVIRQIGPLWDFTTPSFFWERAGENKRSKRLPLERPTEYLFEVWNVPALADEPYSPDDDVCRAALTTYYGSDALPVVFWSSLSKRLDENMKFYLASSRRIGDIVATFDTTASTSDKIAAAYAWVQANIINGDFPDLPAAAALYEKHPAARYNDNTAESVDEVVKRGYGTTFGINATFVALLRALGIQAQLVWVTDRTEVTFSRSAKYWQFDRTVAAVFDSATGYHYYAPGAPYLPAGLVPWFNENGTALIEGPEGTLVTVSPASASATKIVRSYQYTLDTNLVVSGKVLTRWGGHAGRRLRMMLLTEDESKRLAVAEKELSDEFPEVQFDSLQVDKLDAADQSLQINYQVTYKPAVPSGDRLLLKPFDYCSSTGNPFTAAKRQSPMSFRYAYNLIESVQIDLPTGWKIEALPKDTLFENEFGTCGYQVSEMGAGVAIQRVFAIKQPFIAAAQYVQAQRLFQVRHDIAEVTIVLTRSAM